MMQYIDMLGRRYRDKVTNFEGVAESVSFDLYGCVQIAIRPPVIANEKGEKVMPDDGRWFDASRLEDVPGDRVMQPPVARFNLPAVPGPADKSTIR